ERAGTVDLGGIRPDDVVDRARERGQVVHGGSSYIRPMTAAGALPHPVTGSRRRAAECARPGASTCAQRRCMPPPPFMSRSLTECQRSRPYCSWLDTQSSDEIADANEISPASTTPATISASLFTLPRPEQSSSSRHSRCVARPVPPPYVATMSDGIVIDR